jgi:hypothetical protein
VECIADLDSAARVDPSAAGIKQTTNLRCVLALCWLDAASDEFRERRRMELLHDAGMTTF